MAGLQFTFEKIIGLNGYLFAPLLTYFFIMLCISTVYINAHYFIDIPGGVAMGILGFLLSPRIERRVHQWIEMKRTEISPSRVRSGETK